MKKLLLLGLLFFGGQLVAQEDAWVFFADKSNADFYLANPLEMLSQRALDRRASQNIPLDMHDVPMSEDYVNQVEAMPGVTVMAKSKWLNAVHVRGSITMLNSLTSLPFVANVDFADNSLDAAGKPEVTARPSLEATVQANFNYGTSANQVEMLNGHLLHQQDFTGEGVWIAVLDAGFPQVDVAQPFERLWQNDKILGGYNFVDRNTQIFSRNSHGTMVLSTMGGYVEGQLVGTAPDASYYLFITEDTNSETPVEESYWVEAAEMADSLGVDVINTSLGYFSYDDPDYGYTYSDLDGETSFASRGAEIAFSRGMIVVISAGNSGAGEDPYIAVPADAENVLTVGAVNPSGIYAPFSSIGYTPDGRVKPDVMAQGQGSVIATPLGNVTTGNGTSFAGPIVAGMVASLWQALPNKTNTQIMELVKQSAHLYQTPNAQYGYGIPDFAIALNNALSVPQFMFLPNPVSGNLMLAFPEGVSKVHVAFFSVTGQRVLQQELLATDPEVELDGLSSGVCLYRITAGSLVQTGKIVKQ